MKYICSTSQISKLSLTLHTFSVTGSVAGLFLTRDVREKPNYLVRWKRYTVEEYMWERLEKLENAMNLVEEFEKKIREEEIKRVYIKKEKRKKRELNPEAEVFKRSELPRKYKAKILFRWVSREFEDEYLKKLERSWVRWKEKDKYHPLRSQLVEQLLLMLSCLL